MNSDQPFDQLIDLDRPIEPPADVDDRVRALLVEAIRQPVRAVQAVDEDEAVDISASQRVPFPRRRRLLAPLATAAVAAAALIVAVVAFGSRDADDPTLVDEPERIEDACGSPVEPYRAAYGHFFKRNTEQTLTADDLIGFADAQSALLDRLDARADLNAMQRDELASIRTQLEDFDPAASQPVGLAVLGKTHDGISRLLTGPGEPFGCVLPDLAWLSSGN